MQKSVYSLVLSDDVVAQIDRLAYRHNTNRSNMINQILAEYVSYTTPEKRMADTFRQMEQLLGAHDTFQMLMQPSDATFSMRSAIQYKYNPSVRYAVELFRTMDGGVSGNEIGEFRVSLRSQNAALLLYMKQFFRLWMSVESRYMDGCVYGEQGGKFTRRLRLLSTDGKAREVNLSSEALGSLIYAYADVFDRALKCYFYNLNTPDAAVKEIDAMYRAYLSEHEIVL
ncbi:MAG: hypothetical protein IJ449_13770 [Clostridia bacterium]|nr:hypothetical protein [Clostridia bacterium]